MSGNVLVFLRSSQLTSVLSWSVIILRQLSGVSVISLEALYSEFRSLVSRLFILNAGETILGRVWMLVKLC